MEEIKYVVRGAQVRCGEGTSPSKLNLPKSHGVYVNEKPVLIETDTVAKENVMPFGKCRKLDAPCNPILASHWRITKTNTLIKGQPALIICSVLSCAVGGTIEIETDGQVG